MSQLRYVSAIFCAGLMLPAVTWGASSSEEVGSAGISAGQPTEIEQLKARLELQQGKMQEQQKQIRDLQLALEDQKTVLEEQKKLVDKIAALKAAVPAAPEPDRKAPNLGDVASTVPFIPKGVALILPPIAAAPQIF